jgi:hypothetical protein
MVPPTEKACNGKKADDECSFERGGPEQQKESEDNKESGTCVSMTHHNDESILLCRPSGRSAKGARLSSDPELSAKVARLKEIRQQPNFQSDAKLTEELTKLKSEIRETRSSFRGNR